MSLWEYRGRLHCAAGCSAWAGIAVLLQIAETDGRLTYGAEMTWHDTSDANLPPVLTGDLAPASTLRFAQDQVLNNILFVLRELHREAHGNPEFAPFTAIPRPERWNARRGCANGWDVHGA